MRMREIWLAVCVLTIASTAQAIDNADCFACHADKDLVQTNAAG